MKVKCLYDKLVPISELKLNPQNRNVHPRDQIERLASILAYQGWRFPVKVSNLSGMVVSGHGRVEAALFNKWDTVPVNFQDYDDADSEYADSIADNSIASWSELDLSGVQMDVAGLSTSFNVDHLGFRDFKIETAPIDTDESEEFDQQEKDEEKFEDIPAQIESRTKLGDQFKIGPHLLYNGDCLEVLKKMSSDSVDSLVTDPPAGISFMGKEWDDDKGGSKEWIAWLNSVMTECLRVMKPGAHGLVWAIPRTSHWTATALEDAGFEIRDVITHLFGSGFPKSLDISKAIDKAAGAEREVIGREKRPVLPKGRGNGRDENGRPIEIGLLGASESHEINITAPSTPEAKQWQGYGTALKPASENWILIRKPCSEDTVAANVLKWGVGGLNIDESRISTQSNDPNIRVSETKGRGYQNEYVGGKVETIDNSPHGPSKGRWPSHLILSHNFDCVEVGVKKVRTSNPNSADGKIHSKDNKIYGKRGEFASQDTNYASPDGTETVAAWKCTDGCAVSMLDEQSGPCKTGDIKKGTLQGFGKGANTYGEGVVPREYKTDNASGASRFFYCAKPSRSEKNDGLDSEGKPGNGHPTVKSIKLMQYLITMVTPPEGLVLDCFGGSGTTLVAAHLRKFQTILIEKQTEYCDIILARAEFVTEKHAEVIHGST